MCIITSHVIGISGDIGTVSILKRHKSTWTWPLFPHAFGRFGSWDDASSSDSDQRCNNQVTIDSKLLELRSFQKSCWYISYTWMLDILTRINYLIKPPSQRGYDRCSMQKPRWIEFHPALQFRLYPASSIWSHTSRRRPALSLASIFCG